MKSKSALTILRWGLAFVFFYAAIAALISPEDWSQYIPQFATNIIPASIFLTAFSVFELVLAGFLFLGKKLYWASLAATILLGAIVVFDFDLISIVFRDVGLAFAALALFEAVRQDKTSNYDADE